jgi:FMN phosphatase YigB (HAD superfamily)
LEADGFAPYFKSVVLSSIYGKRKPHPDIYHEACARAEVSPACSAYVGDNLDRDVTGTRAAGFGMVILMMTAEAEAAAAITPENKPDVIIHEFRQLLDLFPERKTF